MKHTPERLSKREAIPVPTRARDCRAEDWLAFLGHRWNALALWHLSGGSMRFIELQTALVGITPKVLTERLAGLTRRGLITRTFIRGAPSEAHYTLTPAGRQLTTLVAQLHDWAVNAEHSKA